MSTSRLAFPRSDLTYGNDSELLFPEFIRRKIAVFSLYKLEEFDDLPGPEQSRLVAFYNLSKYEELLLAGGLHGG
jgi:hypothetical protein